jgi:mRNA interferase RelE/StbE
LLDKREAWLKERLGIIAIENMEILLDRKAAKALDRINEPMRSRIGVAIGRLALEPPEGDIKKLSARDDYRVRIGDYRIIFRYRDDKIIVTGIAPRGGTYKD